MLSCPLLVHTVMSIGSRLRATCVAMTQSTAPDGWLEGEAVRAFVIYPDPREIVLAPLPVHRHSHEKPFDDLLRTAAQNPLRCWIGPQDALASLPLLVAPTEDVAGGCISAIVQLQVVRLEELPDCQAVLDFTHYYDGLRRKEPLIPGVPTLYMESLARAAASGAQIAAGDYLPVELNSNEARGALHLDSQLDHTLWRATVFWVGRMAPDVRPGIELSRQVVSTMVPGRHEYQNRIGTIVSVAAVS